jgi:CRP-like cAMP-binding protein
VFTTKPIVHPALLASELATIVPTSELELLDRLATPLSVAAGDEIVHVDDFGRECFVVIDGEFEVRRGDASFLVGPGQVIGELALLTLKPRTASVTATRESSVYVLNRAEFGAVMEQCPNLGRHILEDAVKRAAA